MIVRGGKHKGKHGVIHQYCNDWMTADLDDGTAFTGNVMNVQLEGDEIREVSANLDGVGSMWREFGLNQDTGCFWRRDPDS